MWSQRLLPVEMYRFVPSVGALKQHVSRYQPYGPRKSAWVGVRRCCQNAQVYPSAGGTTQFGTCTPFCSCRSGLFSLYYFFFNRGYCSNLEPRKYTRTIKGIDKIYYGYEFNTYTFRSFLWIYKSFYKNGKKIVPLNTENFFTPLTLAI